jgi:hypothetical protein
VKLRTKSGFIFALSLLSMRQEFRERPLSNVLSGHLRLVLSLPWGSYIAAAQRHNGSTATVKGAARQLLLPRTASQDFPWAVSRRSNAMSDAVALLTAGRQFLKLPFG